LLNRKYLFKHRNSGSLEGQLKGAIYAPMVMYDMMYLKSKIWKLEIIQNFKRELRSFLLHHTFYFIDEYMSYSPSNDQAEI